MENIGTQELAIGKEYLIHFSPQKDYTMFGKYGANHGSEIPEGVNFELIVYCGRRDGVYTDKFKYWMTYGEEGEEGRQTNRIEWFSDDRDFAFESQFPYFPYSPSEKNTLITIINLNNRINDLERSISDINNMLGIILERMDGQMDRT